MIAEVTIITLTEPSGEALKQGLVEAYEAFTDNNLFVPLSNGQRLPVLGNAVPWNAPNSAGRLGMKSILCWVFLLLLFFIQEFKGTAFKPRLLDRRSSSMSAQIRSILRLILNSKSLI